MRRAALITALCGLVVLALTCAAIATTRGWPSTLPRHLALFIGSGLAWMAAVMVVPRLPTSRTQWWIIVAIALVLRLVAWTTPPAHSDDVYRYLWDGHVERSGINPYRWAPDAAELSGLRNDGWALVNNRQLPTIYPPLAQLFFAATPSLAAWKLVVALGDTAVALLLYIGLADRRRLVIWLWSPLVVIELGVNAHVDGLGIALLVGGLLAWQRGRHTLAGALVAAAAAVKLLPAAALLGMRNRRALVAAGAVLLIVAAPYATVGPRIAGSLGEYSRRWRGNDGLYAILYAGAERLVAQTRFGRRYDLGDSPRLARALTGRDRDEIYPDEVANLLARGIAGALFLLAVAWALRRRASPLGIAEVAIGAFVLLTPALHPWYVLWLLPLVAGGGSWAWMVLAALAPFGYRPLDQWLTRGTWHDPVWTRATEHGLTLLALTIDRWQASGSIVKFGESRPRRM